MFPKERRLRLKKDIEKTFQQGRSFFSQYLGIKFRPNQLAYSRFMVVVGKKLEKSAVKRNKIRRRVRSVLLAFDPEIKKGFDIMLIIRKDPQELKISEIKQELNEIFLKTKLFY